MILLVDRGNTRLKWACLSTVPGDVGLSVRSGGRDELLGDLRRMPVPPRHILVSSVGQPDEAMSLERDLSAIAGVPAQLLRSGERCGRLFNGYRDPGQLGVDRWLAMCGAGNLCPGAFLVVDAGTALTVDAVDVRGRHLGGFIVPGLDLQLRALGGGTARVDVQPGDLPIDFRWGTDTSEAVCGGILQALAGLVDRCFIELGHGVADTAQLILTGGGAEALIPHLRVQARLVPDLLFRGMLAQLPEGWAVDSP
jgi:type III pantothenate kinase